MMASRSNGITIVTVFAASQLWSAHATPMAPDRLYTLGVCRATVSCFVVARGPLLRFLKGGV